MGHLRWIVLVVIVLLSSSGGGGDATPFKSEKAEVTLLSTNPTPLIPGPAQFWTGPISKASEGFGAGRRARR